MNKTFHCQFCGAKIKPNARFCEECGEELYEEDEREISPKEEAINNTKRLHRFLEIAIIANIILILYSLLINWGYFYTIWAWVQVGITFVLSLINIGFLLMVYRGKKNMLFGLGLFAIFSFILSLAGYVRMSSFGLSIMEALILYFMIFWAGYNP